MSDMWEEEFEKAEIQGQDELAQEALQEEASLEIQIADNARQKN